MTRIPGILLSLLLSVSALADSADVRLLAQSPNRFDTTLALVNLGPDVARNVVVTIDIPAALTVKRVSLDAHPCDTSRRPIRCTVGDLEAFREGSFPKYGGLELTAPFADATYEATFTVTSDTPDPDATNNATSISWTTNLEADIGVLVHGQTDRVDPGGSGTFVANICNDVRDNMPAEVRAEITMTNGTIASLVPATGFTCTTGDTTVVCTHPALAYQCPQDHFKIAVRTSDSRAGGAATLTFKAAATNVPERNPADNRDDEPLPIYRWIAVTSAADSGPGSLRDAIADANANCSPGPCRILFEIPGPVPADGWFTITPSEPLPEITAARVTLQGSRQTELTGDTNPNGPEIAIDGRLSHRGLKLVAACEGVVEGLALGNFDEDQGLWVAMGPNCGNRPDRHEVARNHIGVDPSGTIPWPNLRGLRADDAFYLKVTHNVISHNRHSGIWMWRGDAEIFQNRIERNGASGIFIGPAVWSASIAANTIIGHPQMGVAVARGAHQVSIRGNSMKDNGGLGIDWGLDGVSPRVEDDHEGASNAPLLLSARYDAATNQTLVTVDIQSKPLGSGGNHGTLDFFANDAPDGDGERFVSSVRTVVASQTIVTAIPGDFSGHWINATWTREFYSFSRTGPRTDSHAGYWLIMTSELSNAVLVE